MDAELKERVLECLRGLDIGESISADGIADEIGGKLSDVYDALEELENARLAEMHPACRKGSDPTYTLTPKGKRHMQPEIKERPEPEPVKEDQGVPEVRPSADRVCRFCGKVMDQNKLRRHENCCGKNPDRPKHGMSKVESTVEVPDPSEYAEESNATVTIEHEDRAEERFAPNPDRCAGCINYSLPSGECDVNCITEGSCDHARRPKEPQLQDVPSVEEMLGQRQAAEADVPDEIPPMEEVAQDANCDVLALKGSPGMDAVLRILSYCQKMADEGAGISLESSIKISDGFFVRVRLGVPQRDPL